MRLAERAKLIRKQLSSRLNRRSVQLVVKTESHFGHYESCNWPSRNESILLA